MLINLRGAVKNQSFTLIFGHIFSCFWFLGYNAEKLEIITENVTKPLIQSTLQPNIIDGVNYTALLNGIFFMLTAMGAIGLVLQAIPMFFFKFDENEMEEKLIVYRKQKEAEKEQELSQAASV